jgi:hypothetical protein
MPQGADRYANAVIGNELRQKFRSELRPTTFAKANSLWIPEGT